MIENKEPKEFREAKFMICEKGLHRNEIPTGSIFEAVWKRQQEEGPTGDLIIPDISCVECHPRIKNEQNES